MRSRTTRFLLVFVVLFIVALHYNHDDDVDKGTHILHRSQGFSIFSNLYLLNGTFFIINDDSTTTGNLNQFISRPVPRGAGHSTEPTDAEMQSTTEFEMMEEAVVIPGFSIIFYDVNQYMRHYYHWWGELVLGAVRSYSALDARMKPARFIIPNVNENSWRDPAGINGPLMRAAFPDVPIQAAEFWNDLKPLHRPFVFQHAMIVDRSAAHRHPLSSKLSKMISATMETNPPIHFWEPIRQRLIRNLGPSSSHHPPSFSSSSDHHPSSLPLVLYISRQSGNRRSLSDSAHVDLVSALSKLDGVVCRLKVLEMEALSFHEQIEVVASATIMIGVHGNGLTHQLWMPPSPRSTVIEIFYPKTYLHDYSMLSKNMGHKHYAVWNDTTLTFDDGQWFQGVEGGTPEDFHGTDIPVDGETVAGVVKERLRR